MKRTGHAVVIGGSLAGLLAGRILAEHFDRITILERDVFPDKPLPRAGVPQSRHLHVLLLRGQQILEQLFPGLAVDLQAAGAPVLDSGSDIAMLLPHGWAAPFQANLPGIVFSRDLLDWTVRHHLAHCANVQIRQGITVTGLMRNVSQTGVGGVLVGRPNPEAIQADFVVDASGKTSHTPHWLPAIGYEPPAETVVNAFLGYASRLYRVPAHAAPKQAVFVHLAPPDRTRGGALFPIEGNRWIVGMAGGDRDYPPTDEAGFLAFARSLPTPAIYSALQDAEPLTPIYSYRATENRLRHYDRLSRYPENFVVLGQASCAFNPIYGQGMTVAAIEAQILDRALRQQQSARQIQKELVAAHAGAWQLATLQDYRYRGTEGAQPSATTRLLNAYMDQIGRLCTEDTSVYRTMLEVMHMLKPSVALFQPHIAVKAIAKMMQRHNPPPVSFGDLPEF